ncbi:MAG: hypothetical protein R3E65_03040 [Steroidobacteraceae bacterium]
MNDWMCRELKWDDAWQPDRGKVLGKEALEGWTSSTATSTATMTASTYRTFPGVHRKGAYFTRGSGHTQFGTYTEDSAEYQIVLDRLTRKFQTARRYVPPPVIEQDARTDIAIVSIRQLGWCRA